MRPARPPGPRAGSLSLRRCNVYSQNGEDGVIEAILERIGPQPRWFCEFGAWDGRYGSNCYRLLRQGWRGLMIEADAPRFRRLQALQRRHADRLVALHATVDSRADSATGLDHLMGDQGVPEDLAVLSIDIDGFDYQVWASCTRFRPAIVVIEVDSEVEPDRHAIGGVDARETSFASMLALGHRKGYRLAAHTGNMVFVRGDLFSRLQLPDAEAQNPSSLFTREWIGLGRWGHLRRVCRHMTWRRLFIRIHNEFLDRLEAPR